MNRGQSPLFISVAGSFAALIVGWSSWLTTSLIGNSDVDASTTQSVAVLQNNLERDEKDINSIKLLLQETHDTVIKMAARQGIEVQKSLATSTSLR